MTRTLAVDLGGTKTLLRLCDGAQIVSTQRLLSADYPNFESLLRHFLRDRSGQPIVRACIAVAGPVHGRTARVTNLPWHIDADELSQVFAIDEVVLQNDFQALGHALTTVDVERLEALQTGTMQPAAVRALLGPGTGLGQAILVPDGGSWQVLPTEGGHADFAPVDAQQIALWQFLRAVHDRVFLDQLLSGRGLLSIYDFLAAREYPHVVPVDTELDATARAEAISRLAHAGDPLASASFMLFFDILAAHAGNFALTCLPYGGLFLTGGVLIHNADLLDTERFLHQFSNKGAMAPLLHQIPVYLLLDPELGVIGAEQVLQQRAMHHAG